MANAGELIDFEWKSPRRRRVRRFNLDQGQREDFEVEVPADARAWVLPSGRYALPERMTLRNLGQRYPGIELDLELESGRLVCSAIRRQADAPPLTQRRLRIAVDRLIEDAVRTIAIKLEETSGGALAGRWVRTRGAPAAAAFRAEWKGLEISPKRGRRRDDRDYQRVAEVAREARGKGESAIEAIKQEMHASKSTAIRWLNQAEARGLITKEERG